MTTQITDLAYSLAAAWAAGSLIGLERSYHGRAAGFRTHALVGLASGAVMMMARQPELLPGAFGAGILRLDPTRLGQGIVTGVGFLGAGVIFKEGVSVQGLTTAACIWATAVTGMLFGLDLYAIGVMTTAAILATLIVLRWLEQAMPGHVYAMAVIRFAAASAPDEAGLRAMLDEQEVSYEDMSYKLSAGGQLYEFSGTLKTVRHRAFPGLAARLKSAPGVIEFELQRIGK